MGSVANSITKQACHRSMCVCMSWLERRGLLTIQGRQVGEARTSGARIVFTGVFAGVVPELEASALGAHQVALLDGPARVVGSGTFQAVRDHRTDHHEAEREREKARGHDASMCSVACRVYSVVLHRGYPVLCVVWFGPVVVGVRRSVRTLRGRAHRATCARELLFVSRWWMKNRLLCLMMRPRS